MLEVIIQMAEPCAEEIHKGMRALPNWLNRQDVRLLPWPDEQISEMLGIQSKDDLFLDVVQGFINSCINDTPASDLFDAARQLREEIGKFKERRATNFLPLMDICRDDTEVLKHFSEEWLKCVVPGFRQNGDAQKMEILLTRLSAYHEFELEKIKVATANRNYNSQKHRNDAFDARQLVYLSDPVLHFVTCDTGYLQKVTTSPQRKRIHQTTKEILGEGTTAESFLRDISSAVGG
jgi:hypothetical protein